MDDQQIDRSVGRSLIPVVAGSLFRAVKQDICLVCQCADRILWVDWMSWRRAGFGIQHGRDPAYYPQAAFSRQPRGSSPSLQVLVRKGCASTVGILLDPCEARAVVKSRQVRGVLSTFITNGTDAVALCCEIWRKVMGPVSATRAGVH